MKVNFPEITAEEANEILRWIDNSFDWEHKDHIGSVYDLTMRCFEAGLEHVKQHATDLVEMVTYGIIAGDMFWSRAVLPYMESKAQYIEPETYLMCIAMTNEALEDPEGRDLNFRLGYQQYIENYCQELTEDILKDKAVTDPAITDEELDEYIKNADGKVIEEFFRMFQEIGTFHRDYEEYETIEEKELHLKMLKIYDKIFNESLDE